MAKVKNPSLTGTASKRASVFSLCGAVGGVPQPKFSPRSRPLFWRPSCPALVTAKRFPTTSTSAKTARCSLRWSSGSPTFNWWDDIGPRLDPLRRLPAYRRQRRSAGAGRNSATSRCATTAGAFPEPRQRHVATFILATTRVKKPGLTCPANTAPSCHIIVTQGDTKFGVGRAATPPRPDRAQHVRPAQPLPDQCGRRPPPVGDGVLHKHLAAMAATKPKACWSAWRQQSAHFGCHQQTPDWLNFHVHLFHRPRRQVPAGGAGWRVC